MGPTIDGSSTERRGGFTVAGVARSGSDVDVDAVWTALVRHAEDLAPEAVGEDRYGVLYDTDPGDDEFTYLAGKRVESTDDVPPEMTAVHVPEAVYTVFAPTDGSVNAVVEGIEDAEFGDAEQVNGPMFERYGPDEDPTDPNTALELYVPVEQV